MKKTLTIVCSSFTALILLFALFSRWDLAPEVTAEIVFQAFAMTGSIALLMLAYEKIAEHWNVFSFGLDLLVRILLCYGVVFGEGVLFRMFPFQWSSFLLITPVLLLTFAITYGVTYFTCRAYADAINESIRRRKNRKK